MAVYTDQPPRSRRFMKVYLATWALLAVAALAYLGLLAFHPIQGTQARPQVAEPDPGQAMRALAKTTVEMGTMRRNLSEIQKDVADLKEASADREAKDKTVTTRLTAVEERLATLHPSANPPDTPPSKAKVSERHQRKTAPTVRVITVPQDGPAPAPTPLSPSSRTTALPCRWRREALRRRRRSPSASPWLPVQAPSPLPCSSLQVRPCKACGRAGGNCASGTASLAALEPRVVPPRSDGGPYRLLAGPFATKADADRVCTEMGVGRNGCYVTTYIGTPL